jgi:hypothetical protein
MPTTARTTLLLLLVVVGLVEAQSGRRPSTGSETTVGVAVPRLKIGLDANPKATSTYRRDDYVASIALMRTTGANHFHYAKMWAEIERTPRVFDTSDVSFMMSQSAPLPVAFNLRVVDAGARNMPDAYKGLAWDSSAMRDRVIGVIDAIAPVLGNRPWSYAVGNEIDMYFATRRGEINQYARLLESAKAAVRALHPEARFTASFQFAAVQELRTTYAPIVALLDHVTFTYYPLGPNFVVRPEDSIESDLQAMLAAAAPRPLFLQEIGYPTATLLGSSPERQRDFIRFAFEAIRAIGSPRVFGATYLFQADMPEWLVDDIARTYGANSEPFRAFVATLGLRDERDRPKPGWDEFIRQARITRGGS